MAKKDSKFKIQMAVIVILGVILLYNLAIPKTSSAQSSQPGSSTVPSAYAAIIPTGVPAIYGSELGISYDDVSPNDAQRADATIRKLAVFDQQITLSGADLERYINIGYRLNNGIACEYCCGARSVIFETGEAACGCAHSYAMRGLAKYLISKHRNKYTDEQVQAEMGKWKVLFFPGIHEAKASALKAQEYDMMNYINLASNKYRGIEKGQASNGAMVGGC